VLEYTALLPLDGELVRFSYPLRGRFQSERMFRLPRHLRLPGPPYPFPQPDDIENKQPPGDDKKQTGNVSQVIFVELHSRIPLKNIYSPAHEVDIARIDDYSAKISYEGTRKDTEDNFVLYYSFSERDLGINLLTYQPDKKEPGFFMLLMSPRTEISKKDILNKSIIFILDVSGSMSGKKIGQAKEALKYCINHLDKRDRFNIITFSTESKMFKPELVAASRYRWDAIKYVDKIEAKGGTNINEAILDALQLKNDVNQPISIVFLTDGLPTVGETDIGRIIRNVSEANRKNVKIFTFGVGYDVNTVLLDRIAASSRAMSDYIEPGENIEQKIAAFYDKISHPVMVDLDIDFGDIKVEDVFPRKLPDLFKGAQLTVLGRYESEKKEKIRLTGRIKSKEKSFSYEADFTASNSANDFLPYLWATRKIGYLMDEIRLHGENAELKEEITRLSKKYGVMSPYTSFLVRDDDAVALQLRRSLAPAAGKALDANRVGGVYQDAEALYSAVSPEMAQRADRGVMAVKMSKASRAMKEATSLSGVNQARRVGNRTFYLKDGYWVDSDYRDEKTIAIKYSSQAFLDLVMTFPEISRFVALGEKVIFRFRGKFIKIGPKGRASFKQDELKKLFQQR